MPSSPRPGRGIRSGCCWARRSRGCRSWCRSGTGGCWCRRSPSTGARRCRWRRTWPARPPRGCGCSCAGTRTCPISGRSPRRSGAWSSTSTTSTRPCPARSSGTSSGWPRAWRWRAGTTGSPPRPAARSPWRRPSATARRCAASPRRPCWTSGTRTWTSSRPSASSRSQMKAKRFKATQKMLAKAHTADSTKAQRKLTAVADGRRRIISDPPMIVPIEEVFADVQADAIYERDPHRAGQVPAHPAVRPAAPAGAVHAGAGGPQGGRGRQRRHPRLDRADGAPATGPSRCSCRPRRPSRRSWRPTAGRSQYTNQGERVVAGQHLMQAQSDIFLGWTRAPGPRQDRPRLLRPPAQGLEILLPDRGDDPLRA